MTKDQIANEKVALQKALLYYESIHGRPVCEYAGFSLGVNDLALGMTLPHSGFCR